MRRLAIALLVTLAACGSSTAPDLASIPEQGTYDLVSQGLAPGAPAVITHDGTIFTSDVYVLSGGAWSRSFAAINVAVGTGVRTPFSGTMSGTYERLISSIMLHRPGLSDLQAAFTGGGMSIVEGDYLLTYTKR